MRRHKTHPVELILRVYLFCYTGPAGTKNSKHFALSFRLLVFATIDSLL
jgi:hypothetical protein